MVRNTISGSTLDGWFSAVTRLRDAGVIPSYGAQHLYSLGTSTLASVGTITATAAELASGIGRGGAGMRGVTGELLITDNETKALNCLWRTMYLRTNSVNEMKMGAARHAAGPFTHLRLLLSSGAFTSGHYIVESWKE